MLKLVFFSVLLPSALTVGIRMNAERSILANAMRPYFRLHRARLQTLVSACKRFYLLTNDTFPLSAKLSKTAGLVNENNITI